MGDSDLIFKHVLNLILCLVHLQESHVTQQTVTPPVYEVIRVSIIRYFFLSLDIHCNIIILLQLTPWFSLAPGTYLVSHKKGDWNATVYKSTATSPSSTSTSIYDLHEAHHNPPVLDTDTTSAFVPAWGGPKEQVPWTFAPAALQSRKGVVGQEKATSLRYCFQFADTGTCSKTDVGIDEIFSI